MQAAYRWSHFLAPWVATLFCATLSLITVVAQLWLVKANGSDGWGWSIPFLCFLPMCFFYAGAFVKNLQDQVTDLQRQVTELKAAKGP